ncbi:hypothetical protein SmJEL517_g04194 [Synchytrium microbalum]|uniref:EamA domain-containing protein n=1 Tax=Synchytrium microbalum TaxID=1806994 RepID=A0A507C0Y1_9FUNG|nr:uncharacterized protein SmJEL517_g04194 [Synchytrium microbalum]TPX32719.1 hypothetical protein SmJEL517_g04194 [Synchytrium microbalum]
MSNFVLGVLAATLGNVCIGSGQVLQKYALNKLDAETSNLPTSIKRPRRKQSSPSTSSTSDEGVVKRTRFGSPLWWAGMALCYFGEAAGNMTALSLISASIVTPLGCIAVIVNALLGKYVLGEQITSRQRSGYILVILGVFFILIASPKTSKSLGETIPEVLAQVNSLRFTIAFGALCLVSATVIYGILVVKKETLGGFVAVSSMFGCCVVNTSKILSTLIRVSANSDAKAIEDATVSVISLVLILVGSIVVQEVFKQQAMTKFNVSVFFPNFFSAFNALVGFTSIILFREAETTAAAARFLFIFSCALGIVYIGSDRLQVTEDPRGKLEERVD